MIDSLLSKITGLWDKNFLFGSFLPALIFAVCISTTFAYVLGFAPVWSWVDTLTTYQRTTYLSFATLALIVVAYVLNALRVNFRRFWCGQSSFPPLLSWSVRILLEDWSRRKFRKMSRHLVSLSPWKTVLGNFEASVLSRFKDAGLPVADGATLRDLIRRTDGLRRQYGPSNFQGTLELVAKQYEKFEGNSLSEVFFNVKRTLIEWDKTEQARIDRVPTELDRQFGSFVTIRATRLGNVVEAHNQYCLTRYNIAAEMFWSRLRGAIRKEDEYLKIIDEPVILLDFALTMATLSAVYATLAILVGPWLWYKPGLWSLLFAFGLFSSWQFYEVAVAAARQSGELMRATFDLFRLEMMTALGRPHPANLQIERQQWGQLSSLAALGNVDSDKDFGLQSPNDTKK
jgi:hypothetical protein